MTIDKISGNIVGLDGDELILVGTNSMGNHVGGLALQAVKDFGLKDGHSRGVCGQCYCIDTMSGVESVKIQLDELLSWMLENKDKQIVVTRIGEGIANIPHQQMKRAWGEAFSTYGKSHDGLSEIKGRLMLWNKLFSGQETLSIRVPADRKDEIKKAIQDMIKNS